jgi:LAO/AO transport system kinase
LDLIGNSERKPIVLKASAKRGKGIKELAATIDNLLKARSSNYKEKERKMLESELNDMVLDIVEQRVSALLNSNKKYFLFIDKLAEKRMDPYQAAEELAAIVLKTR